MEKHLGVEKPKAAEPGRAVWAGNAGRERIKGRSLRLEGPLKLPLLIQKTFLKERQKEMGLEYLNIVPLRVLFHNHRL